MPITSTAYTWGPYAGNGSSTTFAYGQPLQSINDLSVFLTDNNGVVYAPLTSGVDYQVNGVGNPSSSAWTITYPLASGALPLPAGWTLTINLAVALTTNTSITTLNTSTGPVIQSALDRLTLQDLTQQCQIQTLIAPSITAASQAGAAAATAVMANYAPLASPALTGTPTAPTAMTGSSTTQLATTAFVNASVDTAVSGANGQLAYFTGTNVVSSSGILLENASSTNPVLTIVGSAGACVNATNSSGPSSVFEVSASACWMGTTNSYSLSVITNNTIRQTFLATGGAYWTPVALSASSAVAINCSLGNFFTLTPAQAETITATNLTAGQEVTLLITTSGTTSYTLTFSTGIATATTTLTTGTTSGKRYAIFYVSDGTSLLEVSRTSAL